MLSPTKITLKKGSKTLFVAFSNGQSIDLSFEYLRVFSPSAEVRGHGQGQEVLQWGKANVVITKLEPIGHYGLKLVFDDGHDSGIYTWDYLQSLSKNHSSNWQDYLAELTRQGKTRDSNIQILKL